jgi:hypothetical protein
MKRTVRRLFDDITVATNATDKSGARSVRRYLARK